MCHQGKALGLIVHHLRNFGVLRVLGVGELEEHAKGEECSLDSLDGRPARREGIEADSALFWQ